MTLEIPCPEVPALPENLTIPLPFGGELQAFHDFSQGMPDDCTLVNNILVQLAPTLGSLACLLKVLDVLGAVKTWIEGAVGPPPNPVALATGATEVLEKLGALAPCITAVTAPPLGIIPMIKAVLETVVKMLKCIISAVESVLDFQAGIDLDSAEGNPVLLASLECARDNSQATLASTLAALGPIEPIFTLLEPLTSIAGLSIETPPLGDLAGMSDQADEAIGQVKSVVTTLEDVIGALP